jgi:hypothetical protein
VTGQLRALVRAHLPDLLHVAFVSNKYLADPGVGESLDFVHPLPDVVEGLPISHIVHDYNTMGASVVAASERAEPLLPCCVPYLQLHYLIFQLDSLDLKIDTNRVEEVLVK